MFRTLALLVVVITASCASALSGIEATALRLEFANGICSGTAVGPRVVLTADHCFADGNRLLKINGKEAHALKIERDGKDHVLVRVTTRFKRYARMGPPPAKGDRVRWVGMPSGMDRLYRQGYYVGDDEGFLMFDAPAYGGDSGSGLHDDEGRLVAVLSGMRMWQNQRGFHMQLMVAYPLEFTPEQWAAVR